MTDYSMQFDQASRTFSQHEFTLSKLQPGQVLIEVTCCTLCGSDLHTYNGRRPSPAHCVLGHEIIGKVAAWGGNETPKDYRLNELQIGQRVTWAMAVGCGNCFYCLNNLSQKCESLFKYGHEPGAEIPTGGLSSRCVLVPGTPIFSIPDVLSDEVAAPANCATATVSASMRLIEETHAAAGATILIIGAGMLGLTAAAQMSTANAANIIVVDPNADRLKPAASFGATHTICTTNSQEIQAILADVTNGRGADIAMDFAGVTPAVQTCIDSVRTGGCVLLAGSVFPAEPLSLSPESLVRRVLTIRGLHNYLASDLERAIDFLEQNHDRFPFHELVASTFSLADTQRAFEHAETSRDIRVAVRP